MENQPQQHTEKKQENSFWLSGLFNWAFTNWGLDEKELRKEVEQYDTLSWGKSSRKSAAAVWGFFVVFSLVLGLFGFSSGGYSSSDIVFTSFTYLIFIPLIYKGYRLALVLAAILWLWEKGYTVLAMFDSSRINFLGLFLTFVFTIIMLKALYAAFVVEQAHSKFKKS